MEHTADMGIHVEADSLPHTFEESAEAMLNLMFELESKKETGSVTFGIHAKDISMLLVEVLNEILSIQDRHGLAVKRLLTCEIKPRNKGYLFIGTLRGEPFDDSCHPVKTEVKAATLSGLKYEEKEGKHIFECVFDL